MPFSIEPPDRVPLPPPRGAVQVLISLASRNEITVNIPIAHVDKMFENFTTGAAFTITSVTDPLTGMFDRVSVNPSLVEYVQVKLEDLGESANVRNIQRVRPFDPSGGGS